MSYEVKIEDGVPVTYRWKHVANVEYGHFHLGFDNIHETHLKAVIHAKLVHDMSQDYPEITVELKYNAQRRADSLMDIMQVAMQIPDDVNAEMTLRDDYPKRYALMGDMNDINNIEFEEL